MQTAEIRRRFLELRRERATPSSPSAPLVYADPSLLFTVAGMVPFIPYFTGREAAPWDRATSVQKCVRTLDIEEVGKTTRHGTFFQMNGNFSFGDYFKEGAIQLRLGADHRRSQDGGGSASTPTGSGPPSTWTTTRRPTPGTASPACPKERINRRGKKDNYWHTGAPGPGGPCSEIYFDRGPEYGRDGGPAVDGDRYLEIWNLVFMQYELDGRARQGGLPHPRRAAEEEHRHRHGPGAGGLPAAGRRQHVRDRRGRPGAATARPSSPASATAHSGHAASERSDVRLRVVADHVRSGLMLIGDGVTPGNEGRGYILRRLLRRAVRSMKLLGVDEPTLPELLPVSARRDERQLPRARRRLRPHLADRLRRGGGVPPHARRRDDAVRHRGRAGEGGRATPALVGRPGVRAARHLRLPDRRHPRDGRRAGRRPSTRRASARS